MLELNLSSTLHESNDFFSSLELLRRHSRNFGFEVSAYTPKDLRRFADLTPQQRIDAAATIKKYVYLYEEAIREEIRPYDEAKFLWYSLRKWRYTPSSDLFDKIEPDDYIEVYNNENIQIHRSFNYFNLSSYTLADIFTMPWTDLYDRDARIEKQILEIVTRIFKGEITTTTLSNLDAHYLRESASSEKRVYKAYHRYFSPIKDVDGNQTGFVVLSKAERATEDEFYAARAANI